MADLKQRAALRPPALNVAAGLSIRYVPVAGTNGWNDAWCMRFGSPFAAMMRKQGFDQVYSKDGRPFRWTTNLTGLKWWGQERDWQAGADALCYFLERLPYEDRNVIAHSHGGQVAIFLAASGVQLRTLTTVGTPVRKDVPAFKAALQIGLWLHIYDMQRDWTQLLGMAGDGHLQMDRRFLVGRVLNRPLQGIGHSAVLKDPAALHYWTDQGWLDLITAGRP